MLEHILRGNYISYKLQDKEYAQAMYAALCNQSWAYPALAPKGRDWVEVIKENHRRNMSRTDVWWRKLLRKTTDAIRQYITLPLGLKRIITVDANGMRILKAKFTPFLGKIDLFIMRLRFCSLLCPMWNSLDWVYGCSWRYAGGLIADIRNETLGTNEDYMDFYCSGSFGGIPEGTVTEEIEKDLNTLGWFLIPEEE